MPSALAFLATWVAGGGLAFAGAMAYAELAALRPRAGGEYVYLRDAFGPLAGFLTGMDVVRGRVSPAPSRPAPSCSRSTWVASSRRPRTTRRSSRFPLIPGTLVLTASPQSIVAIAAIFGMAWIHLRGVGPGRLVSDVLAVLKVAAFVLFIAIGFSFGQGTVSNITQSGPMSATNWLLALIPVMFTYSGWNAASYVAEEVRDPGRNVPLALALGTGAVIVIYLLLNALYLYVLPVNELAAVNGSVLDVIADRLLGAAAGNIMGVVSIVSLLASISAMTFAGPRVYFAMARDGQFFKSAAQGPSALQDAGRGDHRAGGVELASRALGAGAGAAHLHRVCDHPVFWGRGGVALRAARASSRTPSVRSARGGIRWCRGFMRWRRR